MDSSNNAGGCDAFISMWVVSGATTRTREWSQQYGTSADDEATGVGVTEDGWILMGGTTNGSFPGYKRRGTSDPFLVRISPTAGD